MTPVLVKGSLQHSNTIGSFQHCYPATLQPCNPATLQPCNTTTLQHSNTATQQHCNAYHDTGMGRGVFEEGVNLLEACYVICRTYFCIYCCRLWCVCVCVCMSKRDNCMLHPLQHKLLYPLLGRAASGEALAPQPPRATFSQPGPILTGINPQIYFFCANPGLSQPG